MSRRTWPLLAVAAVVGIVGAGCEYDPAAFAGNPSLSECNGVPATVGVGYLASSDKFDGDPPQGSSHYGTEGDDVVVIVNGPVNFYAQGGNDLICINETGFDWGPDDWWIVHEIGGGSGNDWIINHTTDAPGFHTILGSGADVYVSTGDTQDSVSAYADGSVDYIDGGAGTDYLCGIPDAEDVIVNFEHLSPSCGR